MTADVAVAIIGTIGVIGAAGFGFLGVWVQSLRKAVGEPNGNGNISSMLSQLLAGQAGQDERLANLEHRLGKVESRIDVLERRPS